MYQFNVSKEVYSGPCHEYTGFWRTVILNNGTKAIIHITDSFSDESGGSFSKEYATNLEALDSLGAYLHILRAQKMQAEAAEASLIAQAISYPVSALEEVWQKIRTDYDAHRILLPDNGIGFRYS